MSTTKASITVICDSCGRKLDTGRSTPAGARGDARRAGWRIGWRHPPGGASNDPGRRDECNRCRTDVRYDVGLFGEAS